MHEVFFEQLALEVFGVRGYDGARAGTGAVENQRHQVGEALPQSRLRFDDDDSPSFNRGRHLYGHVDLSVPCLERRTQYVPECVA